MGTLEVSPEISEADLEGAHWPTSTLTYESTIDRPRGALVNVRAAKLVNVVV